MKPSLPPEQVPHEVFDGYTMSPHERFDVWRESILPLFEPYLEEAPSADFLVKLNGYHLQNAFFCMTSLSAQSYRRLLSSPDQDDANHLLLQLYLKGGYIGHNGYRDVHVRAGDVSLLDLGRALETRAVRSDILSLVIPRQYMTRFVRPELLNYAQVLPRESVTAQVLSNHMLSAWHGMDTLTPEEVPLVTRMLCGTTAGAFSADEPLREETVILRDGVLLETICNYIHVDLASSELTADNLCRRFACSRAKLYRLFQPLGGVSSYIRNARLRRCLQDLSSSSGSHKSVTGVAQRWGFSSPSHFTRVFREAFDMTPQEARDLGRSGIAPPRRQRRLLQTPAFHDWLRQI